MDENCMETPSFKEDHISQIPALQFLQKLGYSYLSPDEALQFRGNKTSNILLEEILRKQLKEINSIKVSSSKTSVFSDSNIENGIQALKDLPMHGKGLSRRDALRHKSLINQTLFQTGSGQHR